MTTDKADAKSPQSQCESPKSWADLCEEEDQAATLPAGWESSASATTSTVSTPVVCPEGWTSSESGTPCVGTPKDKPASEMATRRRPLRKVKLVATVAPAIPSPILIASPVSKVQPPPAAEYKSVPVAPIDACIAGSGAFITSSVRMVEPTIAQVYTALAACGLIVCDRAPPAHFKTGTDAQFALYSAFYDNPRGIRCKPTKDAVHSCWKMTTSCLYSKLIAIIYELVDHVMTKERISEIDISDFTSIYGELVKFTGNHWFGVYPLYENARIHVETFSHQCLSACPIMRMQREIRGVDQKDREILQKLAIEHMMMYKHAPMGSGTRGTPYGDRSFRDAPRNITLGAMLGPGQDAEHRQHRQRGGVNRRRQSAGNRFQEDAEGTATTQEERPAPKPVSILERPAPKPAVQEERPTPKPAVQEERPAPKPAVQEERPTPKPAVQEERPAPKPADDMDMFGEMGRTQMPPPLDTFPGISISESLEHANRIAAESKNAQKASARGRRGRGSRSSKERTDS